MNKTIRTAIATAAVGGVLLAASPASAAVASYDTDFSTDTITTNGPGWRMSGAYDAEIADGVLRISNSYTQSSFGDMLFSPELAVGAVEGTEVDTFKAAFTLKPVALQPGLRVTISPDNGSGARTGFLAVEHRADGLALQTWGSYFRPATETDVPEDIYPDGTVFDWKITDVVTKLNPKVAHKIQIKMVTKADTPKSTNNDVFSVKWSNKPAKTTTFEAYYTANKNQPQRETDTLMFRISGTAVPSLLGKGLLIDDLSMSTS